jgi:hypothetical protein
MEWHLDVEKRTLYFFPNHTESLESASNSDQPSNSTSHRAPRTAPHSTTDDASGRSSAPHAPPVVSEAALLDTLVRFRGSDSEHPVRHVEISGVRFAHAATTQLNRYEVPSGGDWAVHRWAQHNKSICIGCAQVGTLNRADPTCERVKS